jgi:ABC-type xylose transport system permease subunit
MLVGAGIGAFHGFLVSYQRIPSFIVTLGGLLIYRGAMLAVTRGETIPLPLDSWLKSLGNGNLPQTTWGVPVPLLCVAALAMGFGFIGYWTRFGRHVYAVGGNVEAAYLSGVNTRRVVLGVFALMGALTAIAGSILVSRVGSASPEAGRHLELDAIAACVIGGTSLMGGKGSIPGAMLGALVMESLNNGMSLANMGIFWQDMMRGAVLVLAVWFDIRVRRKGG